MQYQHLQELAGAANVEELQRAIEAMCQPFGNPTNIRLLPDGARNVYVCFLDGGSPDLNSSMIENLGGFYFANGVAFIIPFKLAND